MSTRNVIINFYLPEAKSAEQVTWIVFTLACQLKVRWSEGKWKSFNHVWLLETPRTIQSMEFFSPKYSRALSYPSPGDLLKPGIEPRSPTSQADSLPAEPLGKVKVKSLSPVWLCNPMDCIPPGSSCIAGDHSWIPWSGWFPWRRKWQPTPVLLSPAMQGIVYQLCYQGNPW